MSALHPHGHYRRYNRGCRCRPCTDAAAARLRDYVKRRHLNRGPLLTDPTGVRRRLQALSAVGWSFSDLAVELGVSPQAVYDATRREKVGPQLRRKVEELYDRLSMTPGPSRYARTNARRHGWPPPLAWDDAAIDDPQSEPCTDVEDVVEFDPVAVERFLANDIDWRACTVTERLVAALELDRLGVSRNDIAALVHVNSRRLSATFAAGRPVSYAESVAA